MTCSPLPDSRSTEREALRRGDESTSRRLTYFVLIKNCAQKTVKPFHLSGSYLVSFHNNILFLEKLRIVLYNIKSSP